MKLAIPCFVGGKVYVEAEEKKPDGITLANTQEVMKTHGDYKGILVLLSGSIKRYISSDGDVVEDEAQIKRITREMPYISAEALAISIMGLINTDDKIEGVYTCPRCGEKIITGYDRISREDTRDSVSDLEVVYLGDNGEAIEDSIPVSLSEPIKIMNEKSGEILQEIETFEMRFPTMNDCIMASAKYGYGKEAKMQFEMYANSVTKVNGTIVDDKWKRMWGMYVISRVGFSDLKEIGNVLQKYGMQRSIRRVCRACGREWDAVLNTNNFFVSGLQ